MKTQKELMTTFKNGKLVDVWIMPELEIIDINDIPRITRKRRRKQQ